MRTSAVSDLQLSRERFLRGLHLDVSPGALSSILAGVLTVGFLLVIDPLYTRCSLLPERHYDGAFILGSALSIRSAWALILQALLCFAFWKRTSWESLRLERIPLKACLVIAVAALAWIAFSEYNYYFSSWYLADRALLVLFAAGFCIHPGFLPLLLMQLHFFHGQFEYPLGVSWTGEMLPLQFAGLFSLFVSARCIWKVPLEAFFIAASGLIGAHYLLPAIGKLEIDWFAGNQISNFVAACHWHNGWLSPLSPEARDTLIGVLTGWGRLLNGFTILIELGVICFLFHRRAALILFGSLVALHLSIFTLTGIFFWKWILVDLVLMTICFTKPACDRGLFGITPGLTCCCIMTGYAFHSEKIVKLAWFDTKLSYAFRFEAVCDRALPLDLTPASFAPYDTLFAQGRFHSITTRKRLVGTYGSAGSVTINDQIEQLATTGAASSLIEAQGENRFDPLFEERFRLLLQKFSQRENARRSGGLTALTGFFSPPPRIWTRQPPDSTNAEYDGQQIIRSIRVSLEESLFLDGKHQAVSDHHILNVPQ